MTTKISKYFTLEEMVFSQTAARRGIDNSPCTGVIPVITSTACKMDKVRKLLGHPVIVSSGYRSPELNAAIGGSPSSSHVKGEAVRQSGQRIVLGHMTNPILGPAALGNVGDQPDVVGGCAGESVVHPGDA